MYWYISWVFQEHMHYCYIPRNQHIKEGYKESSEFASSLLKLFKTKHTGNKPDPTYKECCLCHQRSSATEIMLMFLWTLAQWHICVGMKRMGLAQVNFQWLPSEKFMCAAILACNINVHFTICRGHIFLRCLCLCMSISLFPGQISDPQHLTNLFSWSFW